MKKEGIWDVVYEGLLLLDTVLEDTGVLKGVCVCVCVCVCKICQAVVMKHLAASVMMMNLVERLYQQVVFS